MNTLLARFTTVVVLIITTLTLISFTVSAAIDNVKLTELEYQHGVVNRIIDGDTIVLDTPTTDNFRLAGIDTPETYLSVKAKNDIKNCKVSKYLMTHLGYQAKERLEDLLPVGTSIEFTIVSKGWRKRYVIWNEYIITTLVKEGHAVVEEYYNLPRSIMLNLKLLEQEAKASKAGIWRYFDTKCF